MVLKVVTDSGSFVCASVVLAPSASATRAASIPPPRRSSAQKADPSVNSARSATFPCCCSYVTNAGSASVT